MAQSALKILRRFVPAGKTAESLITFNKRDSRILSFKGQELYAQKDVEAPEFWSDLAVDIAASKYFRRTDVPGSGAETSVRQLVHRVAHTIAQVGLQEKYFASSQDAENFEQELAFILFTQKAAFNSPVWFNLGLFHQYGIRGNGGNFRLFPEHNAVREVASNYEWPQVSACFILSVADDLMSIFELVKTEAKLFKYGSGTGTNFSTLRGREEFISGGGTSSGLIAFLEVLDRGAGATKSGGTTRRAAKMVCLDADHPDIIEFVRWKMLEEMKAQTLIKAGYPSDMDGPAYRTVAGQNSNNSVRLSDDFFVALKEKKPWALRSRLTGEVVQEISAQELWTQLQEAAWYCADPGVQFSSRIEAMNPCANSGAIRASNPCSEYMFLDDSACNLASLNLVAFCQQDNVFNVDDFMHVARLMFIAQDILVGLASYPTSAVAKNSAEFRPLGLGYANLGALLMRLGLPYGADVSATLTESLTALMHACAGATSAELAAVKGAFAHFEVNRECFFRVLDAHSKNLQELRAQIASTPYAQIYAAAERVWAQVLGDGRRYGFRNAQWTVIAPTGTIGLLMDCDTTGIEPDFSLLKLKKLSGGGHAVIVNQSVAPALRALGYSAEESKMAFQFLQENKTLKGAIQERHLAVFDCASEDASGRSLQPHDHLKIVAAAQKYLSGAVSKTVNIPHSATAEDIGELYRAAYNVGLKSLSVYRAGSKWSEPLTAANTAGQPKCSECGYSTISAGGCYRCLNCGHAESC